MSDNKFEEVESTVKNDVRMDQAFILRLWAKKRARFVENQVILNERMRGNISI